jgi:hypothetical protein
MERIFVKRKFAQVGRFVNEHKVVFIFIAGITVGAVVGYKYRAGSSSWTMPGSLHVNFSPEQVQWMKEPGNGSYIHGDHTTGIFETKFVQDVF